MLYAIEYDNAVNQSVKDPVFSVVLGQPDFFFYGEGSAAEKLTRPVAVPDRRSGIWSNWEKEGCKISIFVVNIPHYCNIYRL